MTKQRTFRMPFNVQAALSFICVTSSGWCASAQCTQQPPKGNFSVSPKHIAYYKLDSSLADIPTGSSPETPISQIVEAFNAWSAANSGSGGDGVTFMPSDASNPPSVTVLASTSQSSGTVAQVGAYNGTISSSSPAILTIYQDAVLSTTGAPAFSASSPGYSTAFLQVALHEIGHLQGLGDYPPSVVPPLSPQSSVMEPFYGTNDVGNAYQKTAPTPCDIAQAEQDSALIASGAGASGSGNTGDAGIGTAGDGAGGGGVVPCGTSCTWDDETNTLTCDLCS